jgi:hypothetical protein
MTHRRLGALLRGRLEALLGKNSSNTWIKIKNGTRQKSCSHWYGVPLGLQRGILSELVARA